MSDCIEMCDARSICVQEEGVQAWFRNPEQSKIRKIHYDGCYNKTAGVYKTDFILGLHEQIDIVIELKGSHSNLKHAYEQVVSTLEDWRQSPIRYQRLAALIVYGSIWSRDDLPRRKPKALSSVQAIEGDFRKYFRGKIRLLVQESGEKQFTFKEFLRRDNAR